MPGEDAVTVPPYTVFASLYDRVMADIEYGEWAQFVIQEAVARGWTGGPVLDLACGTGNSAAPFLQLGFPVTGVDASEHMLGEARRKFPDGEWIRGTFTDFTAGRKFGLVQCVFDALNNILDPGEFVLAARRVHAHLEPGGVFMFDVNTSHGLEDLWEGETISGWLGSDWYGWKHSWDEETRIATVEAGFLKDGQAFLEVHRERAYDQDELRVLLERAGFSRVDLVEFPFAEPAEPDAPRIWVVAVRD